MDFSRRDVALVMLVVGILMIAWSMWIERTRNRRVMPSLIPPLPLLIVGGTIAFIAFVVFLLPVRL